MHKPRVLAETLVEVDRAGEIFKDVSVLAKSAYVYDISNQKVIWSKNETKQLPLASITKLMTALTALEILPKDVTGVSHSFTGNLNETKEYINRGMCLGFNGIITFARQYDEVVKYVPLDNILLETDAPYLTPEPYRGQRNEPLYVKEVAKRVAELKNILIDEVIVKTTQNVIKLFGINV